MCLSVHNEDTQTALLADANLTLMPENPSRQVTHVLTFRPANFEMEMLHFEMSMWAV